MIYFDTQEFKTITEAMGQIILAQAIYQGNDRLIMKTEKKIFQWLHLMSPFLLCLCITVEIVKARQSSTEGKYAGIIHNDVLGLGTVN